MSNSQTGAAPLDADVALRGERYTGPRNRVAVNAWHQRKRAANKAAGRCINGPVTPRGTPHAPPLPGHSKCQACVETHRRSR